MKTTNSNFILRNSVFETNSSSCHSLALTKGDNGKLSKLYTDYQLDENGDLHFNVGEYGWGVDVLSDFQSKLDYVMTYAIRKGSTVALIYLLMTICLSWFFSSLEKRYNPQRRCREIGRASCRERV